MFKGRDKKCKMFSLNEFEEFIDELFEGEVAVNADYEGISFEEPDNICDISEIYEKIGAALDVEVTSIHIDDADIIGVWVVHK